MIENVYLLSGVQENVLRYNIVILVGWMIVMLKSEIVILVKTRVYLSGMPELRQKENLRIPYLTASGGKPCVRWKRFSNCF